MTVPLKTYEELRSQAFIELGIDESIENEHGEIDATEEQWALVDKRVHELQFEQRKKAKSNPTQEITSEIGKFLLSETSHDRIIRDHIPNGLDNFQFYHKDKALNWYEFWNHVSDNSPWDMRFETTGYRIAFNENVLKWEYQMDFKDENIEKNAIIVTERLNAYEYLARAIRTWEKRAK